MHTIEPHAHACTRTRARMHPRMHMLALVGLALAQRRVELVVELALAPPALRVVRVRDQREQLVGRQRDRHVLVRELLRLEVDVVDEHRHARPGSTQLGPKQLVAAVAQRSVKH
jgi:hypothetical protein